MHQHASHPRLLPCDRAFVHPSPAGACSGGDEHRCHSRRITFMLRLDPPVIELAEAHEESGCGAVTTLRTVHCGSAADEAAQREGSNGRGVEKAADANQARAGRYR